MSFSSFLDSNDNLMYGDDLSTRDFLFTNCVAKGIVLAYGEITLSS